MVNITIYNVFLIDNGNACALNSMILITGFVMSQHFPLSSRAKTLTLASIMRMSDEEIERVFIRLRWASNDRKAYCPRCGCTTVYGSRRKGALRWQCKACFKDFSLTSGTLFASRKMPLRAYLLAVAI